MIFRGFPLDFLKAPSLTRPWRPLWEREIGASSLLKSIPNGGEPDTRPWLRLDVPCALADGARHGAIPGIESIRLRPLARPVQPPPFKTGCPSARSSSAVTAITEAARICLTPLIWVHRPGYYSTQDIFFASRRRIARALGLFNSSPPRRSYTSITAREIPHSRAMLIANFHFSFTERQTGLSTSGSVLRASVPPPQSFPCSIS